MSLQDILMKRAAIHFRDQLGNYNGPKSNLWKNISSAIEEEKDKKLAAEEEKKKFSLLTSGSGINPDGSGGNTDKTKLGNLVMSGSYEPGKGTTIKYSTENPSQKATRIKTQLETKALQKESDIIREFNSPGSKLNVTDLINAGIKPSDAEKMETLRVPVQAERENLKQFYGEQLISNLGQVNSQTMSSTINGGLAIPKLTGAGRPEGIVNIGEKTRIESAASNVQVDKEVKSQREKAGELAQRGIQRAASASKTAIDEVVRFNIENFEKFGIKPGAGLGFIEKLLPEQLNRYKASATGAGREAAATVGTQIIPAARAVRMVEIFAKSTAEVGNTVEGNAANAAASMANVWGNALSTNFEVEMKDGTKKRLKEVVNDPQTGTPLSDFKFPEVFDAIGRATEEFKLKTEQNYLDKVYNADKRILEPRTILQIESRRRQQRIAELRSRI